MSRFQAFTFLGGCLWLFFVPIIIVVGWFEIGSIGGGVSDGRLCTTSFIIPISSICCPIPSGSVTKGYAGEVAATTERIRSYTRDGITDCYAGETVTICERILPYTRDGITDCNACETGALSERIISYARDGISDCNAR